MGMVIKNNLDSVRTYNVYNRNTIALSDAMYKVSSGQRINSAADSASDLAISEGMRTRIRSLEQADRNAQAGNNMIKTAEGALSNIADLLSSMREKVMHAANEDLSSTDRTLITTEIASMANQIDRNADVTYNGISLLNADTAFTFQIGDLTSDTVTYSIKAMSSTGLKVNDVATTITNAATANGQLDVIDAALALVNSQLADLGSYETRLGYTSDNLTTQIENLQSSESTIRDLDMAKGMTEFAKYNLLTQASQFMLAQATQNPYSVLNLLQQ